MHVAEMTEAPKHPGLLLAGGIVAVILSVLVGLVGIAVLLISSVLDSFGGSFSGTVGVFGLVILAFGGFGMVSGIGAIMRRMWGKICAIVFGGVNLAVAVPALLTDRENQASSFVYVALAGSIVVLCSIGSARR